MKVLIIRTKEKDMAEAVVNHVADRVTLTDFTDKKGGHNIVYRRFFTSQMRLVDVIDCSERRPEQTLKFFDDTHSYTVKAGKVIHKSVIQTEMRQYLTQLTDKVQAARGSSRPDAS